MAVDHSFRRFVFLKSMVASLVGAATVASGEMAWSCDFSAAALSAVEFSAAEKEWGEPQLLADETVAFEADGGQSRKNFSAGLASGETGGCQFGLGQAEPPPTDLAQAEADASTPPADETVGSGGGSAALAEELDLPPEVIQRSPVLQQWLQQVPDIADEIRNQPSFRTRLRVGYAQFPSSNQASGIQLGIEDVFLIAGAGLTASGSFARSWNDDRESFGAEARYYLLPLGSYVNLAPTVGYRSLETPDYNTNGLDLGFRFVVIPSRGGGADIALSQHWVAPGSAREVSMTHISVGYALTSQLRLGTDIEFQHSAFGQNSRLGLLLEWML